MPELRIGTILQARMGSTRLPSKVLVDLAGRPMLERVIRRVQTCTRPNLLILATSTQSYDDPVADFGHTIGVNVFRGSEDDVVDRYYRCATEYNLDYIVRATGDNPFIDPIEVDRLIDLCITDDYDFAIANAEGDGGFPLGVGVHMFRMQALKRVWEESTELGHREHVDDYIHDNPDQFAIAWMDAPEGKKGAQFRLTVDTEADLARARRLYGAFYSEHSKDVLVSVEWVVEMMQCLTESLQS